MLRFYLGQVFRMPLHTQGKGIGFMFHGLNNAGQISGCNQDIGSGQVYSLIVQTVNKAGFHLQDTLQVGKPEAAQLQFEPDGPLFTFLVL